MISKSIYGLVMLLLVVCSTGASTLIASGGNQVTSAISGMTGSAAGMMEKLNVNTASIESLSQIPGLSPKIGEAIAAYRDANSAFKSVSDLVNIEGIDAGLLEKIKPFLTI
jgi:competence protein ComEA